jgi:hypothetical protein
MIKLLPEILFAIAMFALGITAVFFTDEIRSWGLKSIGDKRYLIDLIGHKQTTWSIRFGGVMAILIGLFIVWTILRNY